MKHLLAICAAAVVASCGGTKGDQYRTVKSYTISTCESRATTDANEMTALNVFKTEMLSNFVRDGDTLIAANHEETAGASGLRQYEGPIYFYLHPRAPEANEAAQGVEYVATAYLHVAKVRNRKNGGEWSPYQRVRTRNFTDNAPTPSGLTRWKCLMNAEIAWATVSLRKGLWRVEPLAISVYEGAELQRLHPAPTRAQIDGVESVQALHLSLAADPNAAPLPGFQ